MVTAPSSTMTIPTMSGSASKIQNVRNPTVRKIMILVTMKTDRRALCTTGNPGEIIHAFVPTIIRSVGGFVAHYAYSCSRCGEPGFAA